MGKIKLQNSWRLNIRRWIPVCLLCLSACMISGCSSKNDANATVQKEENSSGKQADTTDTDEQAAEQKDMQSDDTQKDPATDNSQEALQDEDLAASPLDLENLNTVSKIEESGISYYQMHTTRQTPLPIDEWAKLELISEKGTTVPAYIRFTNITRDIDIIEKQMKQFMEAKHIKVTFQPQPVNTKDEYAMMDYEILIGKETTLAEGDYISFSAVRFPLQIYSTMRSGTFGDQTEAVTERFVSDVSVFDTDTPLTCGSSIKKTVMCTVPKEYTAYGIMIPYMNAQGESQCLYYKLEY